MTAYLAQECRRVLTDILGTYAGIEPLPSQSGPYRPDAPGLAVILSLRASSVASARSGALVLHVGRGLAEHLATALIVLAGEDGDDALMPDAAQETALELGNIVAGNLLPLLAGDVAVEISLAPPRVLPCAACAAAAGPPLAQVRFALGTIAVWFDGEFAGPAGTSSEVPS